MLGLDTIIGSGLKILDKFIPDTNERAKAKEEIERTMLGEAAKALSDQRDINKVEAASPSMFVAGWRPAVGWLCVGTLAWQWFGAPMLSWMLATAQIVMGHTVLLPALPTLGVAGVEALLYALLGIGGLRTVEKVTGSATSGVTGTIIEAAKGLIGKR